MQDALSRNSSGSHARRVAGGSDNRLRLPSELSLASDITALENCLALERAADSPVAELGISTPTAVPYCEFLMSDAAGGLEAACRLMSSGGDNPIPDALEVGSFRLSPLRTAIRYTREGLLEVGRPSLAHDVAPEKAIRSLWDGIVAFMDARSIGFVCGRESLPWTPWLEKNIRDLTERFGLSPELETELKAHQVSPAESRGRSERDAGLHQGLSPTLIEALNRGCRLAFEPCPSGSHKTLGCLWLASRDMLVASQSGWTGAGLP